MTISILLNRATSQKRGLQPHHTATPASYHHNIVVKEALSLFQFAQQSKARQAGYYSSSLQQQPVHTTLSIELPHKQPTKHHLAPDPFKTSMSEYQAKTEQTGGEIKAGMRRETEKGLAKPSITHQKTAVNHDPRNGVVAVFAVSLFKKTQPLSREETEKETKTKTKTNDHNPPRSPSNPTNWTKHVFSRYHPGSTPP